MCSLFAYWKWNTIITWHWCRGNSPSSWTLIRFALSLQIAQYSGVLPSIKLQVCLLIRFALSLQISPAQWCITVYEAAGLPLSKICFVIADKPSTVECYCWSSYITGLPLNKICFVTADKPIKVVYYVHQATGLPLSKICFVTADKPSAVVCYCSVGYRSSALADRLQNYMAASAKGGCHCHFVHQLLGTPRDEARWHDDEKNVEQFP